MEKHKHEAQKEHINKCKMAHMIGVAEYMRNNAKKYGLHPEQMYVLGLMHDIGYLYGRKGHEETGTELLQDMGLNDDILFAIEQHGKAISDIESEYSINLYSDCKKLFLLLEADMSIDFMGHYVGFDGRLRDIEERYGREHPAYETASNNILYIKSKMQKNNIRIISPDEAKREKDMIFS